MAKGTLSPSKKLSSSPGRKSPTKSPSKNGIKAEVKTLPGGNLSRIVEVMMDKICPTNLAASEGLGADNMSAILVEFNKS